MNDHIKQRGAAIIVIDGKLVLIKREKGEGDTFERYYVIPGGTQDEGETIEQTTIREIKEELGITVELTRKEYHFTNLGRMEYFYIAKYVSGELGTGVGEEFTNPDYEKYGSYEVVLVPKEEIKNINLVPPKIKEIILSDTDIWKG